jgi:hypothetical protein
MVLLVCYFFLSYPCFGYSEEFVIHTDKDSYYYQNLENQNTIILPNDEIIDTEELRKLEDGETFRTREGLEIYKAYDGQLFLEENNHDNKQK